MIDKIEIAEYFKKLQTEICDGLEALDGREKFHEDLWERDEGGGGRSRVMQNGDLIEKGGVNFSIVYGPLSAGAAKALKVEADEFFATGVSIVLHPRNPWMPIIHMNVRYFEVNKDTWWFGGGIDLTPHYIFSEDASFFHQYLKDSCDQHHADYYGRFKNWADDYFFIPHRNETRGVGGIFYDRLDQNEQLDKAQLFAFTKSIGESFVPIYSELAQRRRAMEFGERELQWQSFRRSRYVEFNLVWDRGTKFGLETGGRTASILMSMPPMATWQYNYKPEDGSKEAESFEQLKKGIDWINGSSD